MKQQTSFFKKKYFIVATLRFIFFSMSTNLFLLAKRKCDKKNSGWQSELRVLRVLTSRCSEVKNSIKGFLFAGAFKTSETGYLLKLSVVKIWKCHFIAEEKLVCWSSFSATVKLLEMSFGRDFYPDVFEKEGILLKLFSSNS